MRKKILIVISLLVFVLLVCILFFYIGVSWEQANDLVFVNNQAIPQTPSLYQEISINTQDAYILGGWFLAPSREDGASILFLHGRGGNRNRFERWSRIFAQEGYGVLLIDLRPLDGERNNYVTMGVGESEYAIEAFNFLVNQDGVNSERIAIFGHSMGAATAILTTAHVPSRVLIASSSYANIHLFINDRVAKLGIPVLFTPNLVVAMSSYLSGSDYGQANPLAAVSSIHQPSLYLSGDADTTVPLYHSEMLYNAANEPKQFFIIEGANHEDMFNDRRSEYVDIVRSFFEEYLINP